MAYEHAGEVLHKANDRVDDATPYRIRLRLQPFPGTNNTISDAVGYILYCRIEIREDSNDRQHDRDQEHDPRNKANNGLCHRNKGKEQATAQEFAELLELWQEW